MEKRRRVYEPLRLRDLLGLVGLVYEVGGPRGLG